MDHLWTPWRYSYVSGTLRPDTGCVFCRLPASPDPPATIDSTRHIVHRGTYNYIVLNRFPYTSGHILVVPFRHFAEFSALRPEEGADLLDLAQRVQRALSQIYQPEGFNIGWNQGKCAGAGVADHLHLHVVPRWVGDTNVVGVLGETRIIPEDLDTTYRKLKPHFV